MKKITLTRGLFTIVDDSDFDALGKFKWHALRCGNHFRPARHKPGTRRISLLHREIMDAHSGAHVDHINGNPLDNRRENLRLVTRGQNMSNRHGAHKNSRSGLRGVHWDKNRRKWMASIQVNGKKIWLGGFHDTASAADCYAKANRKYFGEYGGTL